MKGGETVVGFAARIAIIGDLVAKTLTGNFTKNQPIFKFFFLNLSIFVKLFNDTTLVSLHDVFANLVPMTYVAIMRTSKNCKPTILVNTDIKGEFYKIGGFELQLGLKYYFRF